jgi:hypothetical protein
MWQEIIVFGCVAVAFLFVARKYWPKASQRHSQVASGERLAVATSDGSGCGSCRGCSGGGCH